MKKLKSLKKPTLSKKSPGTGGTELSPVKATVAPGLKTPEPKIDPEKQLHAAELDSLIGQAEAAETGARSFMEPAATVAKKKRGRPTKEEVAAREPQAQPADALPPPPALDCKPAFQLGFGITSAWLVRYTGESRMALLPEEIEALAQAWAAVAEKHLPTLLATYALEFTAVIVTGTVGIRLYAVTSEIIKEREALYEERLRTQKRAREQEGTPSEVSTALQ